MNYVDVTDYNFLAEPRYYFYGWSKSAKIFGRPSAVAALVRARRYLPRGWNFKVWDMQRPRAVQLAMIASFQRRLKVAHPELSPVARTKLVYTFAAKPTLHEKRIDTHRNGGAVDLTIVDNFEEELYMGTDHDDLTERAALDYFVQIKKPTNIEKLARHNRRLLRKVMGAVGFENYHREWWHWSYPK